jgi:hypothetical protein
MSLALSMTWRPESSEAMGRYSPEIVSVKQCPPLKNYRKGVLTKSAKEMRDLLKADPSAATPQIIADYRGLRDQCRAYENQKAVPSQ